MRRKLIALTLLAVTVAGITFVGAGAKPNGAQPRVAPASGPQRPQPPADEPGVIDGAKNPELIPDRVAYSLLFRVLTGGKRPESRARIRSYVRQFGTGVQGCEDTSCSKRMAADDVDAVFAAADEFQPRVAALDQRAAEIKKNNWSNRTPEVTAQLAQLQRQKDALMDEFAASLSRRLSPGGLNRLRAHVEWRIKTRTKMRKPEAEAGAQLAAVR